MNIALAPNAVRVLQHVGVYDTLRAQGYSYEELLVTNSQSKYLAKFWQGSKKRYNYACLRIPRRTVQKVLLEEAKAQGIPVFFDKKLVELREEEDKVELKFADGTTSVSTFVIGADGAHSKVRGCIMDTETSYSGFMGIIGMGLQREKMHASSKGVLFPNFIFGKTGFVAIMPSNYDGTEVDFFSTMPYPAHTRQEWEALANDKTALQKIIQERFGHNWPLYVCGITQQYDKGGLDLFP